MLYPHVCIVKVNGHFVVDESCGVVERRLYGNIFVPVWLLRVTDVLV